MSILDSPLSGHSVSNGRESDEVLLEQYERGSLRAREELTHRHMPMARRLANRHRRSREPHEDLEQVAYLGLLKTIDRYDSSAGSFVSYAVTTIRGELKRHFRDHGWTVHVPRPLQERYLKVNAAAEALSASQGHSPTVGELAAMTDLTVDEVVEAMDAAHGYSPPSLDAPSGIAPDETARTLGDTVGRLEPGYDSVEIGQAIRPAFLELPEREQRMLHMRFIEDLTQSEIAARCGISQMHVSRLLRRSLNQLLKSLDQSESRSTV